ncbi:MAG: adenosylcobinamide-GDP ribazoletransferase [Alphaproteobacteria bacterium]|nr:adenosylcobinamide-GDP ribazoletransferase [Alphaproteobacteria bacterium]
MTWSPPPDFRPGAWLTDLRRAAQLLTRLPLPGDPVPPVPGTLARALRVFPVAGALIGLGSGLALVGAAALGLPLPTAALLGLGAGMLLTGALHEDGLADTADGFGARRSPEQRLAIMRDSRIGTYGLLALGLAVALKATALAALDPWGAVTALAAAGAASRAAIALVAVMLPPARPDGLGAAMGRPDDATLAIAGMSATILALVLLGPGRGGVALVAGGLAAVAVARLARRQIGGYTGDVLGATQQTTETVMLLAVAAAP